jgi:hypothetical protein
MSTEYKNWLATKKEKAAEGDVAGYVAWYIEHPSPLGGLYGRQMTRPEIIRQAVSSAASSFKAPRWRSTTAAPRKRRARSSTW